MEQYLSNWFQIKFFYTHTKKLPQELGDIF